MANAHIKTNSVVLSRYKRDQFSKIQSYQLTKEQTSFTAHPLEALVHCEHDVQRVPYIILYNDVLAGFFVLHGWNGAKEYIDNEAAILLRAYSISTSFQGKGIAKQSLRQLPTLVRDNYPEINEIILAVNLKNTIAKDLYLKCGFINSGKKVIGSMGEKQYVLQMYL